MHISQSWLVVILSLSSYVSAFYPWDASGASTHKTRRFIPIKPHNDGSFKLDIHRTRRQTNSNQFSVVNSNAPTGGSNSLAINQDGSDYSYFSTFKFGSKAQEMYMLIDTGSANTWVFSSDCKSESCGIHNRFGKEDSTTLKINNTQWNLAYGTGQVSGIIATDRVSFASYTLSMGFGLALNASDDFNSYPMDGILGLGRRSSDQLGTPTIMEVLDDQAKLQHNVVGVHLHRASDGLKDGEILFGGIDTAKFSGNIAYTKTSNDGAWEIPVEDVLVNGNPSNFTGRSAIIDTGTTFVLMPLADAQAVHKLIPGAVVNGESFTIPCSTNVKLEVRLSGKSYPISPKDYVGKPSQTGSTTCSSNIIGHQAFGDKQWILGDVFLKNVYAVFDFDNKQIGFGLPGTGGTLATVTSTSSAPTTSSSTTATSPSGSKTSGSSGNGIGPTSTSQSDSSIGQDSTRTNVGPTVNVGGHWKLVFSIALAYVVGTVVPQRIA